MNRLSNTKVKKQNPEHSTLISLQPKADPALREKDTIIIGEGYFTVIAGPCALENEQVALETAKAVEKAGAKILRGSLFKPRTSPYTFQGYGLNGVEILRTVRKETHLLIETEILSAEHLETLGDEVDIFRIGSRNMDNYELLKEVGRANKPIILKRNMSATLEEFLLAAEYICSVGNEKIILCERGIRTFETYTRNTLDILAIPALKELTHLPVIVDPSHSTGKSSLVPSASKAALAAGADGLIIEVHPDPAKAFSDGHQSLNLLSFENLMKELFDLAKVIGKKIEIPVLN